VDVVRTNGIMGIARGARLLPVLCWTWSPIHNCRHVYFVLHDNRKKETGKGCNIYIVQNSECSSSLVCESESCVVSSSVIAGLGPKPDNWYQSSCGIW
jgi:hypothetical protein